MSFDPELDQPYSGPFPASEPDFSENQMWNFYDGRYGFMFHVGSMPGDLQLWHNAVTINCPDGTVLASKIVGRGGAGVFGAASINSRTLKAYETFHIAVDAGMRRCRPEELWTAPGADGVHVPVRVDLQISAAHPVWEPGRDAGHSDTLFRTMARMHHEQALVAEGVIVIEGETIEFRAVGHRDHSYGPRDFRKLLRGNWFNATFDSGWSFLTFWGEDASGIQERTAIFDQGQIILGTTTHDGHLASLSAEPRMFHIGIQSEDGRNRRLSVRCLGGSSWFSPKMEWCLGTDLADPLTYLWRFDFAEFECEGERGLGFIDRGSQAGLLAGG